MHRYCIGWIFVTVMFFVVTAKLSISLSDVDITDMAEKEQVKVIEGDLLLLRCSSDDQYMTISWQRHGVSTVNHTVEVPHIRLNDAGKYVCKGTHANVNETKTIFVEVLYPPTYPFIEGQTTGLYGEQVTLKCVSDAVPVPSYQWRRANQNGRLLSRNQTFQTNIHVDIIAIVCIVESLMISTLGISKIGRATRKTAIHGNKQVTIEKVYNNYGDQWDVKEGDDVDIRCSTSGIPVPKVWWTKAGNDSVFFEGNRLTANKIASFFKGEYTCHAQNTVVSVNKTSIFTEVTATINVKVIQASESSTQYTSEECSAFCEKQLPVTKAPTNNTQSQDQDGKSGPDMSTKELLLIIATGVGWTAFVVCSVIYCVVHVKKREVENQRQLVSQTEDSHDSSGYSYMRSLSGSYISQVRLPDNTYMDLDSNGTVGSISSYLEPINCENRY